MAVLTETELRKRLTQRRSKKLVVTPLLGDDQIGASSIDVRLGYEFLLPSRAMASSHDYLKNETPELPALYSHNRRMPHSALYVHPHQFVLGATFEFIGLPDDLMCYVIGRSSLGRAGLMIATAVAVAPGFAGCITLEIVNVGEVPLPLYPGMKIAQLVFHDTIGVAHYKGRYRCPIGPEPPQLYRDAEMTKWRG